ncbi:MAG TPA: ABC transporter substrate-binding protein, partial [Burkholderiales bacterium]|nr:ABC transporter substrate-binding protein [Burkholderiales bacterium]
MTRALFLVLSFVLAAGLAAAEPVKIRVGQGPASEEPLWLMKLKPELTPDQGKAYTLDFQVFRGTDMRFKAYEAGELDLFTGTASANLQAWSSGLKFKAVASLSRETSKGFVTQFVVLDDSSIKSIRDLKGKVIGNTGARSSTELWLRLSLIKEGLDPDRDVSIIVVPFPAQGGALRAKKLDVATLVQPFYAGELAKGGFRTLFTSKHSLPYDEELLNLLASEKFAAAQPEALRAFLKDFVGATKYFLAHTEDMKKQFLDAKVVRIPPEIYLKMQDYYFPPDGRIDIDAYRHTQDAMIAQGFQKTKIDP